MADEDLEEIEVGDDNWDETDDEVLVGSVMRRAEVSHVDAAMDGKSAVRQDQRSAGPPALNDVHAVRGAAWMRVKSLDSGEQTFDDDLGVGWGAVILGPARVLSDRYRSRILWGGYPMTVRVMSGPHPPAGKGWGNQHPPAFTKTISGVVQVDVEAGAVVAGKQQVISGHAVYVKGEVSEMGDHDDLEFDDDVLGEYARHADAVTAHMDRPAISAYVDRGKWSLWYDGSPRPFESGPRNLIVASFFRFVARSGASR